MVHRVVGGSDAVEWRGRTERKLACSRERTVSAKEGSGTWSSQGGGYVCYGIKEELISYSNVATDPSNQVDNVKSRSLADLAMIACVSRRHGVDMYSPCAV